MVDYIGMAIVYLFFYRALKAQGIPRTHEHLPYVGWAQPYVAYIGLVTMIFTVTCYGYTTLLPGAWDIGLFFSYYTMVFLCPLLLFGWKIVKKTKMVPALEADLVWERPQIDAYEAMLEESGTAELPFWEEVGIMTGLRKRKVVVRGDEGTHVL